MVTGESKTSYLYRSSELEIDFSNCTVSIAADAHSVSFGVFDNFTSEILHLERHSLLDKDLDVLEFPFSNQEISTVLLTQKGGTSTLIPNSVLGSVSDKDIRTFLSAGSEINSNKINTPEAEVFYTKLEITSWLEEKFPQARLQHNTKPLIENILNRNRYQKGMKIYVDVSERSAEIVVIRDNQLIKYSSEEFSTASDLLFHITAQVEIHGFNQLEDFLFLSGLINNSDEIYTQLKQYIKNVRLNSGLTYQKISVALGVVPKHHFFTVINAFQCA